VALVGFLLMSWFSAYVQFCYCKCLLWKKLWARVLIVSVIDRLDLVGIVMVTSPLTATLV
jgi:hypothetical protein